MASNVSNLLLDCTALAALANVRSKIYGITHVISTVLCKVLSRFFLFPRSDINPELYKRHPDLFKGLERLYGSDCMGKIDLYVGGMLESTGDPGELFRTIVKEQFKKLRDSDRFWFENAENGILSPAEIEQIRSIKLWDVIVNASSVRPDEVQKNVFFHTAGDPCRQPKQLNASELPACEYLKGYDSFQGSETSYLYGITFFVFFPVFCICAAYGFTKVNNSRRKRAKANEPDATCFNSGGGAGFTGVGIKGADERLRVREWLEPGRTRPVTFNFGHADSESITLVNRKNETLRKIGLSGVDRLSVQITRDSENAKPMALLKVLNSHDLVLEFESEPSRKRFLVKLEGFMSGLKKSVEMSPVYAGEMLEGAETQERRQKRLEHFFREAYALTFGQKPGEERRMEETTDDVLSVMQTSLTRKEFASAMGMRPNSVFVRKMFRIVDKDGDGMISFQEFLDTVVLFSTGQSDDKLRIIFDMCDTNENGFIEKDELQEMLTSLVELAKTEKVLQNDVTQLIDSMFKDAGLEAKEVLTHADFKAMMDFNGDFLAVGLDLKGAKHNFLDESDNIARIQNCATEYVDEGKSWLRIKWEYLTTFLEENRQNIFYLLVFFTINIWLFVERFIHYAFMSEHSDLRHIMGVGISITRGCAAALSFDYSILLLSMSRNVLTKLKETSLHQYIPLDAANEFHKVRVCCSGSAFGSWYRADCLSIANHESGLV